ncbi:MAG TPA: alpha/beta fold hydrolase [Sphingomicrobium sp.]|nr:alpha/beta fold hydrolase [Sphingomicrobium sp.]
MATFILIHGAWHGGWCWERVAPLLRDQGHEVVCPDLPGMDPDQSPLGDDPIDEWAHFVAELASRARQPVILVGHSRGGLVISEAAERVPDAIDCLVYLAAFLLQSGQSLADVANRYPEVGPGPLIKRAADPSRLIIDANAAMPIFYNLTDEEDAKAASRRLTPEPLASMVTRLRISNERFGRLPRAYIECVHDRAVSLEMQREMEAALPCEPVITLSCDHSPFYSAVPELVAAFLSLV